MKGTFSFPPQAMINVVPGKTRFNIVTFCSYLLCLTFDIRGDLYCVELIHHLQLNKTHHSCYIRGLLVTFKFNKR